MSISEIVSLFSDTWLLERAVSVLLNLLVTSLHKMGDK